MKNIQLLDQLQQRAGRVGALEREVRELRKQIETWNHTREAALYKLLLSIIDTSPMITLSGEVEWIPEDGREPILFNEKVTEALTYLDPRPDDDEVVPVPPEALALHLLRQRAISKARKVGDGGKLPEAELHILMNEAAEALSDYERIRLQRMSVERGESAA